MHRQAVWPRTGSRPTVVGTGLGNTLTQTHVDAYAYGTGAAPA
ncbi:hypothetical protein AB0A60_20445 [Streptomyces sp. NPDC046275]